MNQSQRWKLSRGHQHSWSQTQFLAAMASIFLGTSCGFVFAADAVVGSVATADTSVQVEAQDGRVKLLALKSVRSGWNWRQGTTCL